MKFRNLTEQEIDCRVQSSGAMSNGELWARVLLYKDARVDMAILDETVGEFNWQREHKELKNNMYCGIGINMNYEKPEKEPYYVWKWDCGAESYSDKEKGEASDSFKRAGTNWGIGRELYTKIPIMIFGLPKKTDKNGKESIDGIFAVEKIKIENQEITALSLMFKATKSKEYTRCFVWTKENGTTFATYKGE